MSVLKCILVQKVGFVKYKLNFGLYKHRDHIQYVAKMQNFFLFKQVGRIFTTVDTGRIQAAALCE